MAEYLAPGVYVEETSFRAKSIEGVSTSTTGFAGPTLKGPVGGTPELVTSFGDFQRIYGGLENLSYGLNYVAHAVQAYFANGGSRLFVSRAFLPGGDAPGGKASAAAFSDGSQLVARFPGATGNGRITINPLYTPVTVGTMARASQGSLLRVGAKNAPVQAQLEGGSAPFFVPNDGQLQLALPGGVNKTLGFHGDPAEAAGAALTDPTTLVKDQTKDEGSLRLTIDGVDQVVNLPTGVALHPSDIRDAINRGLSKGYARLDGMKLVIGSDRRGRSASVTVAPSPAAAALKLPAATVLGSANNANTVDNIAAVTVADVAAALAAAGVTNVVASVLPSGHLALTLTDPGDLALQNNAGSAHAQFGFTAAQTAHGVAGTALSFYVRSNDNWVASDGSTTLSLAGIKPGDAPPGGAEVVTVTVIAEDRDGHQKIYDGMGLDPGHPRYIGNLLSQSPARRTDWLENLYALVPSASPTAFKLKDALIPTGDARIITLSGGNDGAAPQGSSYSDALTPFEAVEDISIVAAPGHSAYPDYEAIQQALLIHAEKRRSYRIAVLDARPDQAPSEVRQARSKIDSKYAAFYYPWVIVSNPLARPGREDVPREIALPPSGFVTGIFARTDVQRGVYKAPANEVVLGALRFQSDVNFPTQETLNPLGINCLRFLSGRGYRVWGARTVSSDPEWKYVNVRRYFNYVERSIDVGTQWAVFEPNGERLWSNVRETITSFLHNEWRSGALLGESDKEAFFVRCDRSTMDQNDLDNGRLVCLIGMAVVKPAEFVIFRIGQKTADARS